MSGFLGNPWVLVALSALSGSSLSSFGVGLLLPVLGVLARRRRWVLVLLCGSAYLGTYWQAQCKVQKFEELRAAHVVAGTRLDDCTGTFWPDASPVLESTPEAHLALRGSFRASGACEVQLRESTQVKLSLPLSLGAPIALARGDAIELRARLAPVEVTRNFELPARLPGAARLAYVMKGQVLSVMRVTPGRALVSHMDRYRARVRARILSTYAKGAQSLARALVLGESDLSEPESQAFRRSGLLHLLAVSGTHLVVAVLLFVRGLGAVLVRLPGLGARDPKAWAALGGAVSCFLYADFAGGSGSAVRAATMLSLILLTRTFGFRLDAPRALAQSVLLILLVEPLSSHDLSFLLSVLATTGLITLGSPWARAISSWVPSWSGSAGGLGSKLLQKLCESTLSTCGATLLCAPALLPLNSELNLFSIVANWIAAPLGELVALPACLAHTVFAFWPSAERGLALLGSGALLAVARSAEFAASMDSMCFAARSPPYVLLLTPFSFLLARSLKPCRFESIQGAGFGLLLGLLLDPTGPQVGHYFSASNRVTVTAFDVGQGDALALELGGSHLVLVDGGGSPGLGPSPGQTVLLPWLSARAYARVDLMILSHAHPDHLLGLLDVAKALPVSELWYPEGATPVPKELHELIRLVLGRGGRVLGPKQLCAAGAGGAPRAILRWQSAFEVLGPCPSPRAYGLNDDSLVLRFTWGDFRLLLTGDAEELGEHELMRGASAHLAADLLKVGHHGSATSTSAEFLSYVRPQVAWISCGARNRFGHPRGATLEHLAQAGAEVARTDLDGALRAEVYAGRVVYSSQSSEFQAGPFRRLAARLAFWAGFSPHEPPE